MADKKKLSVAEILAAARKADGGGAGAAKPEADAPAEETAPGAPAAEAAPAEPAEKPAAKPASKPAAKPASGGKLSVAEMLAAARAEKAGGGAAPAKPAAKAESPSEEKPKPAPKPAAAKAEKPAAAKPAAAGARDTASILSAARKEHRAGPMTKAEAAARTSPSAAPVKAKPAAPPMPPKPAYAAKKEPAQQVNEGRRLAILSMLVGSSLALGFSTLAATLGLWTLGLARFMFPNILREPPSQFKVGFPGDFAPGQVETKFIPQFGVWVVNGEYNGQRQIYALMSVCTHLGCTPNWLEAEQKFKCPCHGSGFYKDGINFEGPAPRPLERYAIRLADDGQIEIDKSRTFHEEMGAWSDPASFIPV